MITIWYIVNQDNEYYNGGYTYEPTTSLFSDVGYRDTFYSKEDAKEELLEAVSNCIFCTIIECYRED